MAAVISRGSKWWSGNPKRRGKPFEVVGFKTENHFVSRKRETNIRGDTHVLVRPLDMNGSGSRERFIRIDRVIKGGINGYVPLPEVAK